MLGLLLSAAVAVRAAGQAMDSLSVSRRIVAAASLAAKEYAIGVAPRGGRVTAPEEVSEARQFLEQARLDVGSLPSAVRAVADSDLARLEAMIDRVAPPDSVSQRAGTLIQRIAAAAGGARSEEHTSELQSPCNLVCRLLLEKKKTRLAPHDVAPTA